MELLAAATITLMIAGLMLSVVTNVLNIWGRAQGAYTQAAVARQVFDVLTRDLQAAHHQRDSACWMAMDILDNAAALANHGWLFGPGMMKPDDGASFRVLPSTDLGGTPPIRDARFGLSGAWLRFVTTNVESGGSLPTIVAWQIARRPVIGNPSSDNPAPIRYSLYRSVVSDSATFADGYDVLSAAYGSANNIPSSALSTSYRLPRNVTNPSHANLLASNVVDFGCWFYVRGAGGTLERIYPTGSVDVSHHAVGNSVSSDSRVPEAVDAMVRVLSDSGARLLEAVEAGRVARPGEFPSDSEWWWSIVESHSAVFIRRIEIQKGAR